MRATRAADASLGQVQYRTIGRSGGMPERLLVDSSRWKRIAPGCGADRSGTRGPCGRRARAALARPPSCCAARPPRSAPSAGPARSCVAATTGRHVDHENAVDASATPQSPRRTSEAMNRSNARWKTIPTVTAEPAHIRAPTASKSRNVTVPVPRSRPAAAPASNVPARTWRTPERRGRTARRTTRCAARTTPARALPGRRS